MVERPPLVAMAKYKFGLCGPLSLGKTQWAYGLTSRLQTYGLYTLGAFDQEHFNKAISGEHSYHKLIASQIVNEVRTSELDHVEAVVCDTTVIDIYAAYLLADPQGAARNRGLSALVREWALTYTAVYYVPMFENMGQGSDNALQNLLETTPEFSAKLEVIESSQILNSMMRHAGRQRPGTKVHLTAEQVQWVANASGVQVFTRFEVDQSSAQELVFVLSRRLKVEPQDIRSMCKKTFGESIKVDYRFIPDAVSLASDKRYHSFKPKTHGNEESKTGNQG